MGRYSANPSYGHHIKGARDDWEISWTCDRYYKGSRLRWPKTYRRWTDHAGAVRFAKRWGLPLPPWEQKHETPPEEKP